MGHRKAEVIRKYRLIARIYDVAESFPPNLRRIAVQRLDISFKERCAGRRSWWQAYTRSLGMASESGDTVTVSAIHRIGARHGSTVAPTGRARRAAAYKGVRLRRGVPCMGTIKITLQPVLL
ncbi:MAG: hypothetical protein IBX64_01365 [Actinobacteria bacterium]|nr:hypothetical protein [Actinomycetota bacterium]